MNMKPVKNSRKLLYVFVLPLLALNNIGIYSATFQVDKITTAYVDSIRKEAFRLSTTQIDSGMLLLRECAQDYIRLGDSVGLQKCWIDMSDAEKINLNYSRAYDLVWDGLLLAEKLKDTVLIACAHGRAGQLYHIFGQKERAAFHLLTSLGLNKQLQKEGKLSGQELISSYFNMVMYCGSFEQLSREEDYLDTCFMLSDRFHQDRIKRGYLLAEKAVLVSQKSQDYKQAEGMLLQVASVLEPIRDEQAEYAEDKKYLVIVYSFMGDMQMLQGKFQSALEYFNRSLRVSYALKGHMALRPDLLFKSAQSHAQLGQYKQAYEKSMESRLLNDQIFGARNLQNNELLEIKNKYRDELRQKDLELSKKNLQLLQKERSLDQIKLIFSVILLLLFSSIFILRSRYLRKRHAKKQKEARELLTQQNKELTTYALQFVEKEKTVSDLLSVIKKEVPHRKAYLQVIKDAEKGSGKYWDEFNMRFLKVNQGFYERLRDKHPVLTPTDLKICALIKLDFTAKEMAHLVGISATSVNMSRYRLRKKMNLDREVNLSSYISGI